MNLNPNKKSDSEYLFIISELLNKIKKKQRLLDESSIELDELKAKIKAIEPVDKNQSNNNVKRFEYNYISNTVNNPPNDSTQKNYNMKYLILHNTIKEFNNIQNSIAILKKRRSSNVPITATDFQRINNEIKNLENMKLYIIYDLETTSILLQRD